MAQTEVLIKNSLFGSLASNASTIALRQNTQGFLILDAPSYIIRVRFTEEETRQIISKFLPDTP